MILLGPKNYVETTVRVEDAAGNLAPVQEGSARYVVTDPNVLTPLVTGNNPFTVSVDWKAPGISDGKFQVDADLGDGIELLEGLIESFTCTPGKATAIVGAGFGEVKTRE